MAYQKQIYQDGVTEYTEELFEHMDDGIFGAYPVQLIAISDTAPSECVEGDKYYNTSTKKIYTATGTNTWGSTGTTPLEDTSYWLISENGNYAWDGTDLVSIGGGKAEVVISDEEPEEGKLWVDTAEIQTIAGRDRLVNVSNEVDEDYRVNLLKGNNLFNKDNILQNTVLDASTGATNSNNARMTSDYIEVKASQDYIFSNASDISTNGKALCYYNSNKTFISGTELSNLTNGKFTTPANTKYIRFGYVNTGNYANLMLNIGDTALPYEPYITPSINVDGEEIYSKPVVLWKNNDTTSSFASQNISLSEALTNFSYYEINYKLTSSSNVCLSTGRIPVGLIAYLQIASNNNVRRYAEPNSAGTQILIGNGELISTYGGNATTDNSRVIPYQVIGYK